MVTEKGLLIEYRFCTGCHSCEVACKQENNLPVDQWGIKVVEMGPMRMKGSDKLYLAYVPVPTDLCNLCEGRTKKGLTPACVKHCPAGAMKFGTIQELTEFMRISNHTVLWTPRP